MTISLQPTVCVPARVVYPRYTIDTPQIHHKNTLKSLIYKHYSCSDTPDTPLLPPEHFFILITLEYLYIEN